MDLAAHALTRLRAGELSLYRGESGGAVPALFVTAENTSSTHLKRLEQEFALRADLDAGWAVRPVALSRQAARVTLELEDPGGEPLDRMLDEPLAAGDFLPIAIPLVDALRQMHEHGLIHKDLNPTNYLVDLGRGRAWLTGFGLATRLAREPQDPDAPDAITANLAYMSPEQTGRMNRPVDARSDLYSLGVTFYRMLTGVLPFTAAEPLEWIHCHIARQAVAPEKRVATIPAQLTAIVMRLLAKTPEERYQTAAGVEGDLRHCLEQLQRNGRIDTFALGGQDAPGRFLMPDRLHGCADALESLL